MRKYLIANIRKYLIAHNIFKIFFCEFVFKKAMGINGNEPIHEVIKG